MHCPARTGSISADVASFRASTDAHVHFPTWALARREVRLEGVASVEEAVARVRDSLGSVREGGWLGGRGLARRRVGPAAEP